MIHKDTITFTCHFSHSLDELVVQPRPQLHREVPNVRAQKENPRILEEVFRIRHVKLSLASVEVLYNLLEQHTANG
jgi:hypothetical protein